jgi:hypothetical protein
MISEGIATSIRLKKYRLNTPGAPRPRYLSSQAAISRPP